MKAGYQAVALAIVASGKDTERVNAVHKGLDWGIATKAESKDSCENNNDPVEIENEIPSSKAVQEPAVAK